MSRLLLKVKDTAALRRAVDEDLDVAIDRAKRRHSWAEIAEATGLSRAGVRHRWVAWKERQEKSSVPAGSSKETADA